LPASASWASAAGATADDAMRMSALNVDFFIFSSSIA
jgi:hypothetical protein